MLATCPNPTLLKQLLDGTLPEDGQSELTLHLETCDSCQRSLESLVAGKESWDGVAGIGHQSSHSDSDMQQMLADIASGQDPDATAASDPAALEIVLDFLSPPEKSGQLGKLGRYEVLDVIGSGGFGMVLKAIDPVLQRVVAIKVLAPQLATSATARQRFAREAQAAAAVSHDHVVAIHAVEETNGLPYLVMQYIAGESLQQRLDRDPGAPGLDIKEILRIGTQTAAGLAAAHAQGLVHRDIKPANILLENGIQRVKITDFGLARSMDDASLTQTGVITGTPQYMSPEQAKGEPVDHRADLFSLGSVLYALCTGRPPFRASTTLGVLKRVAEEPPRPIREINPDISEWLTEIIDKLHAKQPDERFQSADEIAALLAQHLAHIQQPTLVQRPQPLAKAAPASYRRRRAMAPWGLLGLAIFVALIVFPTAWLELKGVTTFASKVAHYFFPATGTFHISLKNIEDRAVIEGNGKSFTVDVVGSHKLQLVEGRYAASLYRFGEQIEHADFEVIPGQDIFFESVRDKGWGILALGIDDPAVKVSLDGKDLVIDGAGIQRFPLRPGQYTLTAAKDGAPVHDETITIVRGTSCDVQVRIEQARSSESPENRSARSQSQPIKDVPTANPDLQKLQGTWAVVSMHRDGSKVNDLSNEPQVVVFRGNEIYMALAPERNQPPQRGTFELGQADDPKTITIKTTDGPQAGQSSVGIYAFAGDQLMLSLARPGANAKPTQFVTKQGDPWKLALLARPIPSTPLGLWPAALYPRRSPFTGVRWIGAQPQVQVNGAWYELREVNGISVDEIIGYWAKGGDRKIQDVISDHLFEALSRQGREPGPTVKLKLRRLDNGESVELADVPMTEEKYRQSKGGKARA
jgi:uncharacterized protein (TIGR03067 family)